MLLQIWSHHYRRFMGVIINSWIITEYPSAPWEPICSTYYSFPSSFVYPGSEFLWATRRAFVEKRERLSYRLTWSMLVVFIKSLICSFTFVAMYVLFWLFYVRCCLCLFYMSGLYPWIIFFWLSLESWFFDYCYTT